MFSQTIQLGDLGDACIGEQIGLGYASTSIESVVWDFCFEDLKSTPEISNFLTLSGMNSPESIRIVYDSSNWYAFVGSRLTDEVYRLDFGSSLDNSPTINNLGNLGVTSLRPTGLEFLKDSGTWYGFVTSQSGPLIRLTFEYGLDGSFVVDNLGDLGSWIVVTDLDIKQDTSSGNWLGAILDSGLDKASFIEFGGSLSNTPSIINEVGTAENASITNPRGVELIKTAIGWFVFFADRDSELVILSDFGSSLSNSPTFTNIYTIIDPIHLKIKKEGLGYSLFVLAANNGLYRIDFDSDNLDNYTTESLGNFAGSISPSDVFDLVDDSPYWKMFIIDKGGLEIFKLDFIGSCGSSSTDFSNQASPLGLSYATAGDYFIELQGKDSYGNIFIDSDTITILPQTAPSISHSSQEVCVSNPITFSPSNPGLSSYSWDFDGDGLYEITDDNTGFDQSFDYSGLGPGTYTVRLDVNDGTCDNFYEEEITIYPQPPVPAFTVAASECVNTDISFINDTDESQHTGVISYMWDFNDDGIIDSTDPDPTFAYSTPGTKTVVLYDTIPGCSNVSAEFEIDISSGPIAGYAPSTLSACEGETIAFTDTSSVDSQDYFWDFQNGFTSTISNPAAQLYENSGSYFVSLTTTDAQGCEDTFVQEISISASPQISIDFDIPCTSPDGVQFFDLTTVDGADIVSWSWEVDGEEVSTQQNPTLNFSSTGVKTVGLTVQSSNGCEQYVTEDIEVLAAPSPDFSIDLGCQGETTSFTDETESVGNPIVSWLWTVDGVNYGTQDINHVFTNPGTFDVMLEVTGQNFCSETITKTVEIIELPQVNFTVNGECDNQVISAQDQSTGSVDPVISRRWMLDGVNVGNGSQLLLSELEDNTYELELELETESGCLVSSSQILEINEAPEAEFTSSRTYGIPGDRLTFTNNSSGGVSYQWLLDGVLRSASQEAESIEFSTAGTYDVSLVAQNSLGCNDTTTREILIAIPEVDLAIGDFELIDEKTGEIYLEIQNFSNLPVEITEVQIVLANEFSVNEQINAFIGIGESFSKILSVKIPQAISKPSYFCVKLISQYEELEYSDLNPINNEKCITLQPDVQVENPFPNPVRDQFRLKVVTPADGQVSLRLINATGKLQREETYQASAGLNNFFIDMSTLNPGIYFVTVNVLGNTFKRKVVKL
ncbi:PKD domain-containing protein [Ekhidna sp.]|uniref:PKD domain-containing protein n=1 Tax=Ekhidna sp. TaxID=2608089 RepID=UPI003B598E5C